jgi:hypothetical protein
MKCDLTRLGQMDRGVKPIYPVTWNLGGVPYLPIRIQTERRNACSDIRDSDGYRATACQPEDIRKHFRKQSWTQWSWTQLTPEAAHSRSHWTPAFPWQMMGMSGRLSCIILLRCGWGGVTSFIPFVVSCKQAVIVLDVHYTGSSG